MWSCVSIQGSSEEWEQNPVMVHLYPPFSIPKHLLPSLFLFLDRWTPAGSGIVSPWGSVIPSLLLTHIYTPMAKLTLKKSKNNNFSGNAQCRKTAVLSFFIFLWGLDFASGLAMYWAVLQAEVGQSVKCLSLSGSGVTELFCLLANFQFHSETD